MTDDEAAKDILARAEAARKANLAQLVVDKDKERQRKLAASTLGKKVHDIVDFEDTNGDDVFVWIFCDPKLRDVQPGQRLVVMIVLSEQKQSTIKFDEVVYKEGRYWLADGQNLIVSLQLGAYSY